MSKAKKATVRGGGQRLGRTGQAALAIAAAPSSAPAGSNEDDARHPDAASESETILEGVIIPPGQSTGARIVRTGDGTELSASEPSVLWALAPLLGSLLLMMGAVAFLMRRRRLRDSGNVGLLPKSK